MSQIRRALILATGERYFTLAINFLTAAAVSRMLRPDEIGVSLIGLAIIGLFAAAREFASPNFLIQHSQLSCDEVRRAFSVLMLLTLILAVILWVSAPTLAHLYGEDRLAPFLRVVSLTMPAEVISGTVASLLRREIAFAKVALISGSSALTGFVFTIVLALLGFSYMSFAWAYLAGASIGAVLAIVLCTDRRIFLPLFGGWHGVLTFGGYNGTGILLHRLYEMMPYLVLGHLISSDAVAYFHRTLMLCQLPDKVFLLGAASVILPAFSEIVRAGQSLKIPYLNAVSMITGIQWPALTLLALLAHPIVGLLYGEQWTAIVPYVQIMAIAAMFSFSFELNYPVFVAIGAVRVAFVRGLIIWPVSALVFTIAAFFGLKAAALSFLITIPFQALVSLTYIRRHLDIHWGELVQAMRKSVVVVAGAAAGPLLVIMLAGGASKLSILELIEAIVLAGGGWLASIALAKHALLAEIQQLVAYAMPKLGAMWRVAREAEQKG